MKRLRTALIVASTMLVLIGVSRPLPADTGTCGGTTATLPFTDVAGNLFFCQIAEAFFSGLTNGTTPTTYSPHDNVPREQMAAFITRTQDSALRRGSRRAALNQWATPTTLPVTGRTQIGGQPLGVKSDGTDLWVANNNELKRVRASDGSVLGTWTGATFGQAVLVARGRVYVASSQSPGRLYRIDPSLPPGAVTILSSSLGNTPFDITTDGHSIWTANLGLNGGSLSKVDPDTGAATTLTGFNQLVGILFDGTNLWVTDNFGFLRKLDSSGAIVQSVPVGVGPQFPVFDGSNIWVPNLASQSVSVVRARDGLVLATLTGNGLSGPAQAAFDGQRVLVTNQSGDSVSLWNATDLTPVGSFTTGAGTIPFGACSDGINFWVTLQGTTRELARF